MTEPTNKLIWIATAVAVVAVAAAVVAGAARWHGSTAVVSAATGPLSIHQLDAESDHLDGRTVAVAGVVDGRAGILGIGGFRLRDPQGSATIIVLSDGAMPTPNTRLVVTGMYRQLIVYGNYHPGVIVPAALCRKVRDENLKLAELVCGQV